MALRTTYSGSSPPPILGVDFADEYAARLKTLFDAAALPLTAVGGTGNVVTATLDPALDGGGLVDGMKFTLTWANANTGSVTLALNGGSAVPVVDASDTALVASALVAGTRALIEYIGGKFRVLSGGADAGGGAGPQLQVFTASGTWTKPSGYDPDHPVLVRLWAGGGSGARNSGVAVAGGGGGGNFIEKLFRMSDLPSSVAVSIGAGGASRTTTSSGANGGNTTFGSLLTAFGGGGGRAGTAPNFGAGAGILGAANLGVAGILGGGSASGGLPSIPDAGAAGADGGGTGTPGGAAFNGGGGGAGPGTSSNPGGVSTFGGSGGNAGTSGTPGGSGSPRGGGGGGAANANSGAGGRGEAEVWVL